MSSRGPRDGTCLLCLLAVQETVEHALCRCPVAAAIRAQAVTAGMEVLDHGQDCVDGPDPREAHDLGPGQLVPVWFDPSGTHTIRVCPRVPQAALDAMRAHPTLAGFLGVHPPHLDEVLRWEYGVDRQWRRRTLGEAQQLMTDVQNVVIWGGLKVWSARCRALRLWWESDAAGITRLGVVTHASQMAYDREEREERKRVGRQGLAPRVRPSGLRAVPVWAGWREVDDFVRTTRAEEAAADAAYDLGPQPSPPPCY
jgi:hypothetical protein